MAQEEALAGPGLPEHRNVHRAPRVAHAHMRAASPGRPRRGTRDRDSVLRAMRPRSRPPKAVPNRCNELFDEVDHHGLIVEGAATKSGTSRASEKYARSTKDSGQLGLAEVVYERSWPYALRA